MKKIAFLLPLLLLFVACTNDGYDTGDGSLSNMRADFVEAHTNSSAYINQIVTDDGETLSLTKALSISWATKPDTLYRALLYYNKVLSSSGSYQAEPISISQIPVLEITDIADITNGVVTDPVSFTSAWKSKNGKYINLDFYIKIGSDNGSFGSQAISIVYDGAQTTDSGARHVSLRLYHDQNGVPEYYSTETFVSISLADFPITLTQGDEIELTINTYDGTITKSFTI